MEVDTMERSPGDEARLLADRIKYRNMGGNLEGIEGFNLEYNDGIMDFVGNDRFARNPWVTHLPPGVKLGDPPRSTYRPSFELSSAAVGRHLQPLSGFAPAARRPAGTDLGISRPWPSSNAALLSPRVPLRWALSPEFATATRESMEVAVPRLSPRDAGKLGLIPSSQRDAARGFALALATSFDPQRPPAELPSPRTLWHLQHTVRGACQ